MMLKQPAFRKGGVLAVVMLSVAAATGITLLSTNLGITAVRTKQPDPVTAKTVESLLARVGITPESLAAAGVGAESVAGIVNAARLRDLAEAQQPVLTAATEALANARRAENLRMKEAARASAALPAPELPVKAAQQAVETAIADARAQILAGIAEAQIARIAAIRDNRQWEVPMPYRVVSRTDAQWVALRSALAAKRIALRQGASLSPQSIATLAAADSNSDVSVSAASLENNLAGIKAAWDAAMSF